MSNTEKPVRPPVANIAPFGLRMQPELRAKLEAAAARSERSMNSEITARLNQSFEMPAGLGEEDLDALADKLATRLMEKIK